MKKAFIFTLDALFAVSILAVFFVVYSFEMNVPKETYWLSEIGNTFMTSLDKNETFHQIFTMGNDDDVRSMLSSMLALLPDKINANISVSIFTIKDPLPTSGDSFDLNRGPFEARKGIVSTVENVHIKRIFASPTKNLFGLAELVISYG